MANIEQKIPTLGESITEVTIGSWSKKTGDNVAIDEIIGTLESDKASFDITAEQAGVLEIVVEAGTTIPIGSVICKISEATSKTDTIPTPKTESTVATPKTESEAVVPKTDSVTTTDTNTTDSYAKGHPSVSAAKILNEKGVDTTEVQGTGTDGRITKEDALKAEKIQKTEPKAENVEQKKETSTPVLLQTGERSQRQEKMTSLRKTIAKRLVAVKNETAMLTTFNEVNMKPIMELRAKYKDKFKEKHGIGFGFMSIFAKACATALLEFPVVNAQINGDMTVFNDFVDISIAVSTEKGLVVPVVRNVETIGFAGIEKAIAALAIKARDGKLSIPEMTGGTFTITNGGVFGSMMSTPIINAPQSAILGMHNIVERPMAVNGEVKILPMMYLALSYDHRIIDGKDSVSFLVRVKQLLEEPERMLLEI